MWISAKLAVHCFYCFLICHPGNILYGMACQRRTKQWKQTKQKLKTQNNGNKQNKSEKTENI